MNSKIMDGRIVAQEIYEQLTAEIERIKKVRDIQPCLAIISATDDPGVKWYQGVQVKLAYKLGIHIENYTLPSSTPEKELLNLIVKLNNNRSVHGIFVHFPLPPGINQQNIIYSLDPKKDIDGIHPLNQGRLFAGDDGLRPCTPSAVIELLDRYVPILEGKHVVVLGRSVVVGKPLALAFLEKNCTVTVCHSKTKNLCQITQQGDILAVAIGKPEFVGAEYIKPGSVVVDVGTNDVEGKLVGDVCFDEVEPLVSLITPVPGGVGPVTNALCFKNLIRVINSAI